MKLNEIANILKEHELYAYRIAYFMLEHEENAVLATSQALIELGNNINFLTESTEKQLRIAKKVVIRHSLEVNMAVQQNSQA